jgi:hypothetical protein
MQAEGGDCQKIRGPNRATRSSTTKRSTGEQETICRSDMSAID